MKILGKIKNNSIDYNISDYIYLDDKDIFIAVDGRVKNSYLKEIKKLYFKLGDKFLSKIDDFISIYLYDKKNNILILSRDRIGLKQIYYYVNKDTIYFGNDIIDLVNKYKIKKDINIDSLSMYFRFYYLVSPNTIFNNIYKLENGSYIVWKNNKLYRKSYYNIIDSYNKISKRVNNDFLSVKKSLNNKLCNYIKNNLVKEKNVGVYLSSGIDSSLVTAIYSKYSKKKIDTFSIGFKDETFNEASDSKKIADYLGTNHHELYIDEKKVLDIIKKIPCYYTEPFSDPSEFACILLNEYAKENNIKIAATGDGADQLFCGLKIYDTLYKMQKVYRLVNPFNLNINTKFIRDNKKLTYLYANSKKKYRTQCDVLFYEKQLDGLFKDSGIKRYELDDKINSNNWQIRRMILDLATFIPERINTKIDRVSYKNNINVVSPYLSTDIIEYSFSISHELKYYDKCKKYILKEVLYDYIPEEYFSNRKKGFAIPTKRWLQTYLISDLKRYSTKKYINKQNIFNYEAVCSLLSNIDNNQYTNAIWSFYMFQLWYDKYIYNSK